MGVKGLWSLVEPVARPVRMETLQNKRLAVDASIWLHQFLAAMRDGEGNALHGAHIVGFFRRICKLLFHGILPVFVFDGDVPAMKRQTILRRRQRKTEQQETVQATAAKLLATRVKLAAVTDLQQQRAARKSSVPSPPCGAASTAPVAVAASPEPSAAHASGGHGLLDIDAVGQRDAKPPGRATSKRSLSTPPPSEPRPLPDVALSKPSLSRGLTGIQAKKTKLDEEFVLPAASLQGDAFVNDPRMATPDDLRDFVAENITDAEIRRLDLDSMAFRALPIEVQHEIVMEMKTKSRHPSKQRLQAMRQQKNALGFSHMQIQHLVDRRKMMETYADFNRTAGVAVNPQTAIQEERRKKLGRKLVPQRIASERGKQYVLIKDDLADGTSGWTMQAVQSSGKAALERAALAQAAAAAAKLPISLLSSSSESDESHDDDETSITYDSDGVPIDRETAAHQLVTQSHLPDGVTPHGMLMSAAQFEAQWTHAMPDSFVQQYPNATAMLHIWLHDKSLADISAQQDLLAAQLASLADAAEGSVEAGLRSGLDFYAQFLVALAYWKETGCVRWDPDPTQTMTVSTHAPNTTTPTVDSVLNAKIAPPLMDASATTHEAPLPPEVPSSSRLRGFTLDDSSDSDSLSDAALTRGPVLDTPPQRRSAQVSGSRSHVVPRSPTASAVAMTPQQPSRSVRRPLGILPAATLSAITVSLPTPAAAAVPSQRPVQGFVMEDSSSEVASEHESDFEDVPMAAGPLAMGEADASQPVAALPVAHRPAVAPASPALPCISIETAAGPTTAVAKGHVATDANANANANADADVDGELTPAGTLSSTPPSRVTVDAIITPAPESGLAVSRDEAFVLDQVTEDHAVAMPSLADHPPSAELQDGPSRGEASPDAIGSRSASSIASAGGDATTAIALNVVATPLTSSSAVGLGTSKGMIALPDRPMPVGSVSLPLALPMRSGHDSVVSPTAVSGANPAATPAATSDSSLPRAASRASPSALGPAASSTEATCGPASSAVSVGEPPSMGDTTRAVPDSTCPPWITSSSPAVPPKASPVVDDDAVVEIKSESGSSAGASPLRKPSPPSAIDLDEVDKDETMLQLAIQQSLQSRGPVRCQAYKPEDPAISVKPEDPSTPVKPDGPSTPVKAEHLLTSEPMMVDGEDSGDVPPKSSKRVEPPNSSASVVIIEDADDMLAMDAISESDLLAEMAEVRAAISPEPTLDALHGLTTATTTRPGSAPTGPSLETMRAALERETVTLTMEKRRQEKTAYTVTDDMSEDIMKLLALFGIPYIRARSEAESQCAWLFSQGLVDGIVTDDSDVFLFGGTEVYRNMFSQTRYVECYRRGDVESQMKLTRERLIHLAYLLGSDYTDGLPGVGAVTAMEIIDAWPGYAGLEALRTWWQEAQRTGGLSVRSMDPAARKPIHRKLANMKSLVIPDHFPDPRVQEAYLHPLVDTDPAPFVWGKPDVDRIRAFFAQQLQWEASRVEKDLQPVLTAMRDREATGSQRRLEHFFGVTHQVRHPSKRVQHVIRQWHGEAGPARRADRDANGADGGAHDAHEPLALPESIHPASSAAAVTDAADGGDGPPADPSGTPTMGSTTTTTTTTSPAASGSRPRGGRLGARSGAGPRPSQSPSPSQRGANRGSGRGGRGGRSRGGRGSPMISGSL